MKNRVLGSSAENMILNFSCRVAVLSTEDLEQSQSETAPAFLRVFRELVCFTTLILFLYTATKFQSRKVTWIREPYTERLKKNLQLDMCILREENKKNKEKPGRRTKQSNAF